MHEIDREGQFCARRFVTRFATDSMCHRQSRYVLCFSAHASDRENTRCSRQTRAPSFSVRSLRPRTPLSWSDGLCRRFLMHPSDITVEWR